MINFQNPTALLIGAFGVVVVAVAIGIAGGAISRGNISKAMTKFAIVLVAVMVLGLAGVGSALALFGRQILTALGFNIPAS